MVTGGRTCSGKSNKRRRRIDCVTRTSYSGRLGRLCGLGVSCFSFNACRLWISLS